MEQTSAALTASPLFTAVDVHALVSQEPSVPLQHADLNVFFIQTVLPIRLAFKANVLIHASELADKMRDANLSITGLSALVSKNFKATLLLHVIQNRVSKTLNSTLTI